MSLPQAQYLYSNEAQSYSEAQSYLNYFQGKLSTVQAQLNTPYNSNGDPLDNQTIGQLQTDHTTITSSISQVQAQMSQLANAGLLTGPSAVFQTTNVSNPINATSADAAEQAARDARTAYQAVVDGTYNTPDEKTAALNLAQAQIGAADQSVNYYASLNALANPTTQSTTDLITARDNAVGIVQAVSQDPNSTALQKAVATSQVVTAQQNIEVAASQPVVSDLTTTIPNFTITDPTTPTSNVDTVPSDPASQADAATTTVDSTTVTSPNVQNPVPDFRVRIRAKGNANNLSKVYGPNDPTNLLKILYDTNGVLFPYTPVINYSHNVNYNQLTPTHANTDYHIYTNTPALQMQISGQFSAQNAQEALYLLACKQFFAAMTKMHFGDSDPQAGLPPPVLLLSGYGDYMFNDLPIIINSFSMELPNNVDYVEVTFQGATAWVPTLTTLNISVTVQISPAVQRTFDWNKFVTGELMRNKGWI